MHPVANLRKFLAILPILLLLSGIAGEVYANESSAQIHVKGMSCPFCVYGIEKNLKKIEGVSTIQSDFKKSLFTVQFKPDSSPDLKALEKAVQEAGFSVDSIKIEEKP